MPQGDQTAYNQIGSDLGFDQTPESEGCAPDQFQCPDGSCASSPDGCDPLTDYTWSEDYEPTGPFFDDPNTQDVQEDLLYMYEQIGGEDWTGKTFDEWVDTYGSNIPTWEGSSHQVQWDLKLQEMGLMPEKMELAEESYLSRLESVTDKTADQLRQSVETGESVLRQGGGLVTGQDIERKKTERQALIDSSKALKESYDIDREKQLIGFESERLRYEGDLASIQASFEEAMWTFMANNKAGWEGEGEMDLTDSCISACDGMSGSDHSKCIDACKGYSGAQDWEGMESFINTIPSPESSYEHQEVEWDMNPDILLNMP